MDASELPPCGIYKTLAPIGGVEGGRLVYFHNHGDPGPGIYLPESWAGNRANWSKRGTTLADINDAAKLMPLEPEGFYRVKEDFHCCEKNCRLFVAEALVQLGYNGAGSPLLFVPQWEDGTLALPEIGAAIDMDTIAKLSMLRIAVPAGKADPTVH